MLMVRKPGLKFVGRPDQAGYDYEAGVLTQDSAWHTLNIATIVPATAKLALIRMGAAHASTGRYFKLAKVGNTQQFTCSQVATQTANVINEQTTLIECTGQQIAYWATSGTFASLRIAILGWFL